MKRTAILLFAGLVLFQGSLSAQSSEKLQLFFKLSDYYLKRHVYKGLVNYQYSNRNFGEVELLHKTIGEVDLSAANDSEKKAFYINAYNILVIYQVANSYPLARPLDKEGFFDKIKYTVAGEELTLNELEKGKMLDGYKDARFHFVLACAAMSCPKLYNLAFQPGNVDELMQERTKLAINDDNFIQVDNRKKKVKVSKIFQWYQGDFDRDGGSIIGYINKFRESSIPENYKVEFVEYDWALNERKS